MPKVLQSDPKGIQNGALDGHFDDRFCKKPTLHLTAYLLCFNHILRVLGSSVLKKVLLKMFGGSTSPKKPSILDFLFIFERKCVQMEGVLEVMFSMFFSLFFLLVAFWLPLGSFSLTFGFPGHHFATFLDALGIILAPLGLTNDAQAMQNSMKMNPQTNLAGFIFLEF